MKHPILTVFAIMLFTFAYSQKQGVINITTFSFQSEGTDSSPANTGTFEQDNIDFSKDTLDYWNDISQKLIRFEITNRNIKFKIRTLPNGYTGPVDNDYFIKVTISRDNKILRQDVDNFSLYPSNSQGNPIKHYYALLLSEKERGMNDGKYLKIKVELYKKGEPIILTSKTKVLFFDGGE